MTEDDLHDRLAAGTAHLTMRRPAGEVLGRGNRLRRRRRVTALGSIAALGAVGAIGLATILPPGSAPLTPTTSYAAGWGPELVNLDPEVADDVLRDCSSSVRGAWDDITTATLPSPVAGQSRARHTIVVYDLGEEVVNCWWSPPRASGAGAEHPTGLARERWHLPAGRHLRHAFMTRDDGPQGPVFEIAGMIEISPSVDRVTIEAGGTTYEAAVTDRVAMFWLPEGVTLSRSEYEAATVTAYDEDGEVLDTIGIHRQHESPPVG
ncbi:MAG TPA: hypothetical protein VMF51_06450 [Nocardioides sp.]|uniref:hypothetical protein n=1 Tax=Nocardioides sp. TaxID=35761 RepID=UPI002D0C32F4|nr:hypothetical protein [Nocardioides sp.]HTW14750.1 hypothetical protein [Nocardioides sp.]